MAAAEPWAETGARGRPSRASAYFLGVLLVLTAAGALYLWRGVAPVPVYTAARDLPAYHQVREQDLRRDDVRPSELPDQVFTVREALLGRYTLSALRQDAPFDSAKMGPILPTPALDGEHVVGLPGSRSDVLGGRLARGDRVDLLLSPREAGEPPGARLRNLLVLDVRRPLGADALWVVVVAVPPTVERALLRSAGRTRALFVRTSSFPVR